MHPMHCPVRLRNKSWTTSQVFAMRRKCGPKLGPTSSVRDHMAVSPAAQSLNRGSEAHDTTSPLIWEIKGREFKSRQPYQTLNGSPQGLTSDGDGVVRP
jgi:hypothetical protein